MTNRAIKIAAAAGVFAVLFLVALPSEPRWPLCAFHWITGLPCPLCGLTRGLFALAKGHLRDAVRFNALSPLGFAMLFSLFVEHPLRAKLWSAGIAAFAIYGAWRIVA